MGEGEEGKMGRRTPFLEGERKTVKKDNIGKQMKKLKKMDKNRDTRWFVENVI